MWTYTPTDMETSLSQTYYEALGRVVKRLKANFGHWNEIADEAGVAYGTVKHIAKGNIKNPNVDAIESLDRVLSKRTGKRKH